MLNNVSLVGRITNATELRETRNSKQVINFTLAVDRSRPTSDGEILTDYVQIVGWGSVATKTAKIAKKGTMISVVGSLRSRKFDKEGQTHYVTEIYADEVMTLNNGALRNVRGERDRFANNINPANKTKNWQDEIDFTDDDMPF